MNRELKPLKPMSIVELEEYVASLTYRDMSPPGHNSIMFDLNLTHIYPCAVNGDVDLPDLVAKIRRAIIDVVVKETKPFDQHFYIPATGGNGNGIEGDRNYPIHAEVMSFDYS